MNFEVRCGDALEELRALPDAHFHTCVTSVPYWNLRRYLDPGDPAAGSEIGTEPTLAGYMDAILAVADELWRALRADATWWLNVGDRYFRPDGGGYHLNGKGWTPASAGRDSRRVTRAGGSARGELPLKPGDRCLIPERLAIALQDRGWYVRQTVTWCKRSAMPENVDDRPTSATEPILLLAKSADYFYDKVAVREPSQSDHGSGNGFNRDARLSMGGRGGGEWNWRPERELRNWWAVGPERSGEEHSATFPTEIPRRAILAGTSGMGCCPSCGAPWRRLTETIREPDPKAGTTFMRGSAHFRDGEESRKANREGRTFMRVVGTRTIGWEPGCSCGEPGSVPCRVLDPFCGVGTTGVAAAHLGRDFTGIDLSREYATAARRRIQDAMADVDPTAVRPVRDFVAPEGGLFA